MLKQTSFMISLFLCGMILCANVMAQENSIVRFKKFKPGDDFSIVVVPEKNIFEQRRRFQHMAEYLSDELNLNVRVKILPDYGAICDSFLRGKADAGCFGSFSYVLTQAKAGVIPIAQPVWRDGSSSSSGYIFTHKDSGIKTVEDMKDTNLILVHKASTTGYIFQLAYFKQHGIENMEEYFSNIYFAGSHDASAWSVYLREAEVGGCKNHIFNALMEEDPDFKKEIVILAESPDVPSNGLAVRKDLDPELKKRFKKVLLDLDKSPRGREVLKNLKALKFIETQQEDYAPLYEMVEELEIDLKTYEY